MIIGCSSNCSDAYASEILPLLFCDAAEKFYTNESHGRLIIMLIRIFKNCHYKLPYESFCIFHEFIYFPPLFAGIVPISGTCSGVSSSSAWSWGRPQIQQKLAAMLLWDFLDE